MSKYLTALKRQDFSQANTQAPQELQEAPSYSFCSTQVAPTPKLQDSVAPDLATRQATEIDREAFEERAAIREFDAGYSRQDAELLAAWEATQARFQRLSNLEWLARYAPERLPAGDSQENYPAAQIKPGNDFFLETQRRGARNAGR